MSTGLSCDFYHWSDGWYYLLQDWDCPKNTWDWREYATAYGPFPTNENAVKHLHDNHANPGGYYTIDNPNLQDEILITKFAEAKRRGMRSGGFRFLP